MEKGGVLAYITASFSCFATCRLLFYLGPWKDNCGTDKVVGDAVMRSSTFFIQECPTCGRSLQVAVKFLGRTVTCIHCRGEFEACDPSSSNYPPELSGLHLMQRADELLDSVDPSKLGVEEQV